LKTSLSPLNRKKKKSHKIMEKLIVGKNSKTTLSRSKNLALPPLLTTV
jgi:hypothetical protein